MASIKKERKTWVVIYRFKNEEGETKQKWERFNSYDDALKRKHEVEHQKDAGTFIPPNNITVKEFFAQFMTLYGEKIWAFRTYAGYESKLRNYINPIIGDMPVRDVNVLAVDKFYDTLQKQKAVGRKGEKSEYCVTPKTINEIHKLLRCALNQAVAWDIIPKNPCLKAKPPKYVTKETEILNTEDILKTIRMSENQNLTIAMMLAFACTMRIGEVIGLTWDCVDISEESLSKSRCCLFVNKELQRVNIEDMGRLKANEIIFKFPRIMHNSKSILILKSPKTPKSVRKIYIPDTVALELRQLRADQDEKKSLLGDVYTDYNMVIAGDAGYPVEHRNIHKAMDKLLLKSGMSKVVFHSLRHSSTTEKLKLTNGDLKAVGGDTGNSSKMIMEVYSHVIDEDRVETARKFEQNIFNRYNPEATNNALHDNRKKAVAAEIMAMVMDQINGLSNTSGTVPPENLLDNVKAIMGTPEMQAMIENSLKSVSTF